MPARNDHTDDDHDDDDDTVTIPRAEYLALLARSAIPHDVADAIRRGDTPILAFRRHHRLTLRQLSDRSGIALGYLSEIERRRRPGTITAWSRIAQALGTTIDTLVHGLDAPSP